MRGCCLGGLGRKVGPRLVHGTGVMCNAIMLLHYTNGLLVLKTCSFIHTVQPHKATTSITRLPI